MFRSRICVAAAMFAFVLFPGGAHAQDPTGSIEGVVSDATGAPLPRVRVIANNPATGLTKEAETAADGFYRVLLLPVGSYTLTLKAAGFTTLVRDSIEVSVSQSVRVNAQLELSSLSESV
jgi:hypothetical protein